MKAQRMESDGFIPRLLADFSVGRLSHFCTRRRCVRDLFSHAFEKSDERCSDEILFQQRLTAGSVLGFTDDFHIVQWM